MEERETPSASSYHPSISKLLDDNNVCGVVSITNKLNEFYLF